MMNKKEKDKFVRNSIYQLQKIERQAISESKRTFRLVQKLLKQDLGNIEHIKPILIKKLKPLFEKTLFASYLLGQRRSIVCYEKNEGESLRLSIIDDMQNYLSDLYQTTEGNNLITINELQEMLETRSLRILNDVSSDIELQLRNKVNDMISKGYHTKQAISELGKEINNLGLSDKSDFQLETIFRTQTQMAYSSGQFQAIENNQILKDSIQMYEYSAVMDNRTTELCERLDGIRLPHDDSFWHTYFPPNHYNCRSVAIPVFDSEPEITPNFEALEKPDFKFNVGELF